MATSNNQEHYRMETFSVRKLNHSILQIECSSGTAMELNEFFSFYVPGYKFMPAYKSRMWDGKIRLFNNRSYQLPAGLIDHLQNFADQRGYEIGVEESEYGYPDSVSKKEKIDPKEIIEFIHNLSLPHEIRDYQFDAVCRGLERKRAILLSPTGSGKSLIIYVLVRYFLNMLAEENQKVLVIVPTTSLVEQMTNDFLEYGYDNVHKIYSGKDKDTTMPIIVSTWQSIYKLGQPWFEQFGMVIGDECHGFKSKSLTTIMNKCIEAAYRFGTTGTLDGTQTHELVLQGLFGRVYKVTTTRTLQDNDTLAKLEIKRLVLKHKDRKNFGKRTYQDEIDYIVGHDKRNRFIRNLSLEQKGNTLVLFQYVDKHGKILFDLVEDKAKDDRKVFFVSGATNTSDREAIRKITEKQSDAVIIASLGTFSTGINIRNLHNIIFASPSKSQIRVLQSIGRGLRKSDDGRTTQLYDITDDISSGSRQNFALLHSYERLKIYKAENFIYKTYEVEL